MLLFDGLQGPGDGVGPAPGLEPHGPVVRFIQEDVDDVLGARGHLVHRPFGFHIAELGNRLQVLGGGIVLVMFEQVGIDFFVGLQIRLYPVIAGPVVAASVVL